MYTPAETVITKRRYEFACEPQHGGAPTIRDLTDTARVALAKLGSLKGDDATKSDDALFVRPSDDGVVLYFDIEET